MLLIYQTNDFVQATIVICNPGFHRGHNAQRLVNARKIAGHINAKNLRLLTLSPTSGLNFPALCAIVSA
jgi:hypothetical protein